MDHCSKVVTLLVTVIFATTAVSATTVINSQDWKDVYSGLRNGSANGEEAYFVQSPRATGVIKKMPQDDPVTIIESTDSSIASNLETKLESNGFTVKKTIRSENIMFELTEGAKNYIVVEESYPAAAIATAPLAEVTGAEVLIANENNIGEVESRIQDAENVKLVGKFRRDIRNRLDAHSDENIIEPNRFNLSVKLTKRFLERKDAERAIMADGSFLEAELVSGRMPVLLSGTNLVSDPVRQFLVDDPDHDLMTVIMVGNQMTSVGQDLRDHDVNGDKISVFIKYGTARGDSDRTYALNMFPLPQGEINLNVRNTTYDPSQDRLYVTYSNTGGSKMYLMSTLRITDQNGEIARVSDDEPIFLSGEDSKTVSYEVELQNYQDADVEFSTSFGESPETLDTYLTEDSRFSPPVVKNLTVDAVETDSNVSVEKAVYIGNLDRVMVEVENMKGEAAYATANLVNVEVRGETRSFSSETKRVPGDESTKFYFPVKLDRIDLENNRFVDVSVSHGESEEALPMLEETTLELKQKSSVTGMVTQNAPAAGAALALIVTSVLAYLKKETVMKAASSLLN